MPIWRAFSAIGSASAAPRLRRADIFWPTLVLQAGQLGLLLVQGGLNDRGQQRLIRTMRGAGYALRDD